MMYAKKQIINSTWFLGYELDDEDRVTIILHDRDPWKVGAETPETANTFYLEEDGSRTVTHVVLDDGSGEKKLEVLNPQHVFSYGQFERKE